MLLFPGPKSSIRREPSVLKIKVEDSFEYLQCLVYIFLLLHCNVSIDECGLQRFVKWQMPKEFTMGTLVLSLFSLKPNTSAFFYGTPFYFYSFIRLFVQIQLCLMRILVLEKNCIKQNLHQLNMFTEYGSTLNIEWLQIVSLWGKHFKLHN